MAVTARKCLVLNADLQPLAVWPLSFISAEEAIKAVYQDKAYVLAEWDDVYHSPTTEIRVPRVIALRAWAPINSSPKFCRRSILLRDRFICQYCGGKFTSDELTYDHLIPRSKGGKTVWENVVSCCAPCNAAKADKMPNLSGRKGSGLRPLKMPRQPTTYELLSAGLALLDNETKESFADFLYWNVELEQ